MHLLKKKFFEQTLTKIDPPNTGENTSGTTKIENIGVSNDSVLTKLPNQNKFTSRICMVIASLNVNSLLSHHDEIVSLIKEHWDIFSCHQSDENR